jgi:hypothetical protein
MEFQNVDLKQLLEHYEAFTVEGFSIFSKGKEDHLPHLICTCPNKSMARALQSMLEIVSQAHSLPTFNSEVTTHGYLAPVILANGNLAFAVSLIDDVVWKNGEEIDYEGAGLILGSSAYEKLIQKIYAVEKW